jgi:hypothetical protein
LFKNGGGESKAQKSVSTFPETVASVGEKLSFGHDIATTGQFPEAAARVVQESISLRKDSRGSEAENTSWVFPKP